MVDSGTQIGELVRMTLAGAWRSKPESCGLEPESLGLLAPCLLHSGAGGLGWWRLRDSDFRRTRAARELRQAYRLQTLQAAVHEENLRRAVQLFRSADIEPMLIKGWSAARLYQETGLRPYGDLDLCVHPGCLLAAMNALDRAAGQYGIVELHEGVPDVTDRDWDQLFSRSRLCPLGDVDVRILGAEDQLRQLCLHFWRHNACRPLWLCDIGAALEAINDEFDWDYFLTGDPLLVDWTRTVCALACRLLGAECAHPAIAARIERLPRWLVRTVLWKWGPGLVKQSLKRYFRHPAELPAAVLYRWLDPIKACFRMGLPASRPVVWIRTMSLLGQPVKLAVSARRGIDKRRRARRRAPVLPFSLHLQGESRFV